ncbi:spermidine synthase [Streptomyces albofaciens JCM 4342]|uniref:spermidine synthase n=1 Tax=Streptomyces albofaciens TaxID=66866 RepID=UPI00123B3406|nr:spermidine synthase [Streptomyces albofaciens]KAA6220936.1 spermidine synthase [Streptomyces albofaciens JCM 4342]
MIDPPDPVHRGAPDPPEAPGPARLPVPAGIGRLLVLATVFVCAACGIVYELELVALASYLTGDSVTQASVVLSVMVFAMGIGSLLAKRLRCRAAVGFGALEAGLALVGGFSAMALYACYAWFGQSRSVLVAFSLAIGALIGAEVPLLMTLIQRVRRQDAGGAVADLFAADYVGALVGGLAFPFLLLPLLGQVSGALLTGSVNAVAGGGLVLWLFRSDLSVRARWALVLANVLVLALLAAGTVLVAPFERAARDAVYGSAARVAVRTGAQEVVITGGTGPAATGRTDAADYRGSSGRGAARTERREAGAGGAAGRGGPLGLYLDGRLRVSAGDGFPYHEGLVHPAMSVGPHRRVLVLGGGDGLAAREVLRYPGVASVTVVEPDPGVIRLARTDPGLSALNRHALDDPRVRIVPGDVFEWLRRGGATRDGGPYDVIVADLPDPGSQASTKLYSQEFYGLTARALAEDGRLAVHAGEPLVRPRSYWTVDATVRAAGLSTAPYRIPGRTTGRNDAAKRSCAPAPHGTGRTACGWGFVLAARRTPRLDLAPDTPALRSLTRDGLRAAGRAACRDRIDGLPPSTLMHPRHLD